MKTKLILILCYLMSNAAFAVDEDFTIVRYKRETPYDINDDHIIIKKVETSDVDHLAVSGGNIYFEINKAQIVPTEHIKIEEIAKAIKKLNPKIAKISLEGFASKDGELDLNLKLGINRANAVRSALVREGVDDTKIELITYGERKGFQFENINKNRRTQIRIFIKKKTE
jgi:outer membrane protein OmpA-like peptidoglycan-associated protein